MLHQQKQQVPGSTMLYTRPKASITSSSKKHIKSVLDHLSAHTSRKPNLGAPLLEADNNMPLVLGEPNHRSWSFDLPPVDQGEIPTLSPSRSNVGPGDSRFGNRNRSRSRNVRGPDYSSHSDRSWPWGQFHSTRP